MIFCQSEMQESDTVETRPLKRIRYTKGDDTVADASSNHEEIDNDDIGPSENERKSHSSGYGCQITTRRGCWTAEEDRVLTKAVLLYEGKGSKGSVDWGSVCVYMGGTRSYDQCRSRWSRTLKPRKVWIYEAVYLNKIFSLLYM